MPTSPLWLLAAACAAGLVLATPSAVAAPTPAGDGLPTRARAQIEALAAAKAARTTAERKVEGPLLVAAQQRRGQAPPAARQVRTGIRTDRAGRTSVDVQGTVGPALLDRVAALGGVVVRKDAEAGVVHAELPLSAVPSLAALPQVRHIVSLAATPIAAGNPGPPGTLRDDRLRRRVAAALNGAGAPQDDVRPGSEGRGVAAVTGEVASEGDAAHGADDARSELKVTGVGITVGVLSDGVDSLARSVASGDLPAGVEVLPGARGSGDEGTAMLEILHDLAPKAKLAFATAIGGPEAFADNIRALRAAGADVIVDDILYLAESPFQDGPIAQAVADVTGDGALYVSSAGNEGNLDAGTSGNYEGTFRSSGVTIGKFAGVAHDFDATDRVQSVDPVSASSAGNPVILQWADPLGAAQDDYDLFAVDGAGEVVAYSDSVQNGDDDPFEGFSLPSSNGPLHLAVTRFRGADRYFQLTMFRGRFRADGTLLPFATTGVTRGHSAVPDAYSVAAAPAAKPLPFALEDGDPPNPGGPYPRAFARSQQSERFTSDGPRRVFFTPDGAALTPGNLSSTGGAVRAKPDLTAADGVQTSVPGYQPFFGTSAAAAHAAAIAALVLSGRPGISPAEVRAALTGTSLDIEAAGHDRDTGAGIAMVPPVLRAVRAQSQAYVVSGRPVVTTSADGDAFLEPGETATLRVPVANLGDATAPQVSVTVTSPTDGVTVRPAVTSYGSVEPGATAYRSFQVSASGTTPMGSLVTFSVRVRFGGGFSPQTSSGSVRVGQPSTRVLSFGYSGREVPVPDATPEGVGVPLQVSGVGAVSHLTVSVDGSACTSADPGATAGIQHSFVADLVGTLRGPDLTQVTLFRRIGGSSDNMCQTVFTDSAERPIQGAASNQAPFTGSWRPAEPLSAFVGRAGDGTWTFRVADAAKSDTGVLRAVSVLSVSVSLMSVPRL